MKNARRYTTILAIISALCVSNLSLAQDSSTRVIVSDADDEILKVTISRMTLPAIRRKTQVQNQVSTGIVLKRIETRLNEWAADGIDGVQYNYHKTNESLTECILFGITESGSRLDDHSVPMERNRCAENAQSLAMLVTTTGAEIVARRYGIAPLPFRALVMSTLFSNDEWQAFLTDGYVVEQDDSLWLIAGRATNMPWEWQELVTAHQHPSLDQDFIVIHAGDRVMPTGRFATRYLARAHFTLPYQVLEASTFNDVASGRADISSSAVLWALNPMIESPDERIEIGTNISLPAAIDSWEQIYAEGMTPTELSMRLYRKSDYGAFISAICPRNFASGQGSCVLPNFRFETSARLQEVAVYLLNQAVSGSSNP